MVGNGCLHIGHADAMLCQLPIVVSEAPLLGCSPREIYPIDACQLSQHGLHVHLCPLLYHVRIYGRIDGIGEEGPRSLIVCLLCADDGIAHACWQLWPRLADDGGDLEAQHVYIGVLVELHGDASAAIVGHRLHLLYANHACQHALQLAGDLGLYDTGGISRHGERDGERRQGA